MADPIVPFMNRLGGQRRTSMVLVAVGALAVIVALSRWAMTPEWVAVTDSIPMDEVQSWEQALNDANIDVRYARGGSTLTVRQTDLAKARVAVAGAGMVVGGGVGGAGWDLFDETGFGGTEFEEKVRLRRALEGELSRSISLIQGMEHADVRIALPENSYLRRNAQPATASVRLRPRSGLAPEADVVEGIAQLVANAVPGLMPANVSIHDEMGRTLSSGDESTGLTGKQLALQAEHERTLAQRAEELLTRMYGPGNALVQVTAEMNFDQIDRASQNYDPDSQVTLREDRAEIIPEVPEQGASSVTSNTVFGTSQTTETLIRGGARLERLSVAVALNENSTEEDGTVTATPRDAAEIARVEDLVASAVGLRLDRGDVITVTSSPWEPAPVVPMVEEGLDIVGLLGVLMRPLIALIGVITALLLAFRLMSNIKEVSDAPARTLAPTPPMGSGENLLTDGAPAPMAPQTERVMPAPPQPAPSVIEIQDPARTAALLDNWMKEA